MTLRVGDLRKLLEGMDDSDELVLPGGLSFYRFKYRGDSVVCMEVNNVEVELSENFRKLNPSIKVAFAHEIEFDGTVHMSKIPSL